ncbi:hypothetical protein HNY73_007705 [Argiope bruennichi]|uniref:Uncharacterized protein n=1 Tax=Argiope bruennichi TaxID=94029 RepID=A0A8T0FHA4_ARGBR|nr:hypothetical protein HNY73_007705 [Argiope bruennichi]
MFSHLELGKQRLHFYLETSKEHSTICPRNMSGVYTSAGTSWDRRSRQKPFKKPFCLSSDESSIEVKGLLLVDSLLKT